jgi:chemotaxis protein histidine kinase CheA
MADDEAESINAGVVVVDDEDDGVPIPAFKTAKSSDDESGEDLDAEEEVEEEDEAEVEDESEEMDEPETEENEELESDEEEEPSEEIETDFEVMSEPILESEDDGMEDVPVYVEEVEKPEKKVKKEKDKKEKVKKDKPKKEKADGEPKEGGKLSKLFDLLTQDLVPEPTEEELEAEKEAKAAKKQENLSKKDEAKQAKAAEKAAKAEEKEAAKKAKAEETAKKKKEKAEANRVKKEAKAAKKAEIAAANKGKKIPKKNIIAAAIFGITVLAAVLLATSVLSRQGYLRAARRAFYNEDYLAVYQDTYGMDLDTQDSDGLIAAKSEVIMKIQRRYDSYQNNLKMGRDLEALDALIQGLATYDYINADAEQYGVIAEVDKIKDNILDILQAKYGLSEEQARSIMNEEDASAYTIDLDNVLLSLNK